MTDPVSRPSPSRSYGRRESCRPVEVAFDRLFEDGDEKDEMEDAKARPSCFTNAQSTLWSRWDA